MDCREQIIYGALRQQCRTLRIIGRNLIDDPVLVWDRKGADLEFFGGEIGIRLMRAERVQGIGDRLRYFRLSSRRWCCSRTPKEPMQNETV